MRNKTEIFACNICFNHWLAAEKILVLTSMREKAGWVRLFWGWSGQWLIHGYHCGSLRVWIGAAHHCELQAVMLMSGSWQKSCHWSFITPTQENCRCFQDHTYFWTAADICVGFGNSLGQNRENCHIRDSVEAGKYMTLTCSSLFFSLSSVFR